MTDTAITIAEALQVVSQEELARVVSIMAEIKHSRRGLLTIMPNAKNSGLHIKGYHPASETKDQR